MSLCNQNQDGIINWHGRLIEEPWGLQSPNQSPNKDTNSQLKW